MKTDSPPAWRSRNALLLFATVTVIVFAADMVSKYLSFRWVAPVPVRMGTPTPDRQPVIEIQKADGQWVVSPPYAADHPGTALPTHRGRNVIPYVLDLHLMINTGAVFGIGQGRQGLFIMMSIVATAVIGWFFYRSRANERWVHLGLGLLMAGAWGNLYDRMAYAGVRDMFHLFPGVHLPFGLSWPRGSTELYPWIFNVADVALLAGVAILLVYSWHADRQARKRAAAQD
ncbi:MAG: signal peptidase II [Phycisphaeraceae bacterium]|nr:signal peptidase II [Phycisphaeraceae bacterium]